MPASHINGQSLYLNRIQSAELRHQKAVLSLACRGRAPEHRLYERLLSSFREQLRQLKSIHPFVPAALELLNDPAQSGISAAKWAECRRSMEWQESASRLHTFIKDASPTPQGISFTRPSWVKLNRLRTAISLFRSETNK